MTAEYPLRNDLSRSSRRRGAGPCRRRRRGPFTKWWK